jgi:hypothetical protein
MLYKTTPEFLEAFGINSLDDLPAVDLDALQSRDQELPMTLTAPASDVAEVAAERAPELNEATPSLA